MKKHMKFVVSDDRTCAIRKDEIKKLTIKQPDFDKFVLIIDGVQYGEYCEKEHAQEDLWNIVQSISNENEQ